MQDVIEILQRWSSLPFEPSTHSDIEDLEDAVGGELPKAYRTFLRAAGRGMGSLEVGEVEMRLSSILERYAIVSWTPPPPLICIGLDRAPLGAASYYLDRSRPNGDDDCGVLRFRLPQAGERWRDLASLTFVSLWEMLLFWGLVSMRLPQIGPQQWMRSPHPSLGDEQSAAILRALDHWPATRLPHMELCRGYEGEGLAVLLHRAPETQKILSVRIATPDEREMKIRQAMLEDLGLKCWQ